MNSGVGSWRHPRRMCGWIGLVLQSLISQCSVLLISLQSYGGQGEGSALGKVNEKHGCWWRGEPMAALLLFPTISYRAFLKQSGAGRRSRGHRSCLLLVNPYDWKYRVSPSPQFILILPDKLLLFFPLIPYLSASSFVLRL